MRIHKRRAASKIWPKYSLTLDVVNRNARLRRWHDEHLKGPQFAQRDELHRFVREQLPAAIDYIEFGVFEGASLRRWTEMVRDPAARFFGFDTFTGLPEKWELGAASLEQGHFAVSRKPHFDDPRVTLIAGLFQDTLPEFLRTFQRRGPIVIHCDADLYTSTLYVLTRMSETLRPGDVVIFDEFSQPLHEFRALEDWSQSYRVPYEALASSGEYHRQVAIRITS
jgi:hypothetical protein